MISWLSIQDPFKSLSISVWCSCTFSIHFETIFHSSCVRYQLLKTAVYDFHSSLKSVHEGQQFVCAVRRKIMSFFMDFFAQFLPTLSYIVLFGRQGFSFSSSIRTYVLNNYACSRTGAWEKS